MRRVNGAWRPAGWRFRFTAPVLIAGLLLLMLVLVACGEGASTGTTNVQGGNSRAPGAVEPAAPRATATAVR